MASRKRILIFVHDGRGLGHLRRLSRIASELQDEASVMFVTGLHEAAHMIPRGCEFVHLPSLDSIEPQRSRHWGRLPFLGDDAVRGRGLRNGLLTTIVKEFQPHGFISDYLPLGFQHELVPLLTQTQSCRRYFIVRGILGPGGDNQKHAFGLTGRQALREHYNLILATCDERIVDLAADYNLEPDLLNRLIYTGYAAEPYDPEACDKARAERLLPPGATWVVCTAGGGKDGEDLLESCWDLALRFPECHFDLIVGPRSRLSVLQQGWYAGTRIRVQSADYETMPYRLGGADVVICRGGYNSLMEAAVGPARMIVAPIATDYEQVHHARRLAAFRPMDVVDDLDNLDLSLERSLEQPPVNHKFSALHLDGISQTARVILADLAQHDGRAATPVQPEPALLTTSFSEEI